MRAWRASGLEAEEFARGKDFTGRMLRWWAGEFVRRSRSKAKPSSPIAMARVVQPGAIPDDEPTEAPIAILVGRYHRIAQVRVESDNVLSTASLAATTNSSGSPRA